MNAPNSTPSDRDFESLRRAQRAHEPSMEEILASIRSIIADDREPAARATAPKPESRVGGRTADRLHQQRGPAAVRASRRSRRRRRRRPPAPQAAVAEGRCGSQPAAGRASRAAGRGGRAGARRRSRCCPTGGRRVAGDLGRVGALRRPALGDCRAQNCADENLTREMLRPMLKSWLDDNLPAIVERLVRAEIQRRRARRRELGDPRASRSSALTCAAALGFKPARPFDAGVSVGLGAFGNPPSVVASTPGPGSVRLVP